MAREEVKNSLEHQTAKEALRRYNTQSIDKDFDVVSFEEGAEFGYNFAIDKAVDWFEEKACGGWIEDVEVKYFIEDFRKAMKGE